jgi:hypothetical protein
MTSAGDRDLVRDRLLARGMTEAAADRWLEAWEASGPDPDAPDFWEHGQNWIMQQGDRRLADGRA